jgi:hypothetical protein
MATAVLAVAEEVEAGGVVAVADGAALEAAAETA